MERKKRVLIALSVVAACLVGLLAFWILNNICAGKGDGGADAVEPGPILVQEPVVSGSINAGQYQNGKIFSWAAPGGGIISVGLDSGGDNDHIYLNMSYSKAQKDGNSVGFYLKSERGLLEFSDWGDVLADCDSGTNADHTSFYIPGQLYDKVAVMEYVDAEHYGVRWSDDGSDGSIAGTTITARAVNLNTAEFIGVFDVCIAYDSKSGTYSIQSVKSADVRETRELREEERAEAVQSAIAFASQTVLPPETYSVEGWEDAARAGAVVHKSSRTYFARLLNTEKGSDRFVNHSTCQDTFAVTLPISLYGYLTVYLAPQTECIGLTEPTLYQSDDLDLQVYGYDPLNPRSEEAVIVPIDFFSY